MTKDTFWGRLGRVFSDMSKAEAYLWGGFLICVFFAGMIKGYFIPLEIQKEKSHQYDEELRVLSSIMLPAKYIALVEGDLKKKLKVEIVPKFEEFRQKLSENKVDLLFFESHWANSLREYLVILPENKYSADIGVDFMTRDNQTIPLLWGIDGFLKDKSTHQTFDQFLQQKKIWLTPSPDSLNFFSKHYLADSKSIKNFPVQTFREPPSPLPGLWQIDQGRAATIMQTRKDVEFLFGNKVSPFWILVAALPQGQKVNQEGLEILEVLIQHKNVLGLAYYSGHASVFKNSQALLPWQRSNYLRNLDLKSILPLERLYSE